MRPTLLALVFFLFCAAEGRAQYWIQKGTGQANDEASDVSSDGAGNLYYAGYFSATASFGTTNLNSSGITDVFLSKLDAAGVYQWAVKGGGPGSDRALSVKADAAGNSYITGYYYNTATFGSQNVTSAGQQDVFVAKYDPSGNLLWLRSGGGAGADIGNGITVDNSGNVIITGEFAGTATFGSQSLTSMNGSTDVFTVKYDGSGNVLWAEKGSAHLTDRGLDVACDATGNIFITGQFSDTITFDQTHLNNMVNAVFVVKYDPSGAEQWYRRIGGGGFNIANSIAVDNSNRVLLTGDYSGTVTFYGTPNTNLGGTYSDRMFIARYDNSGSLDWATSATSNSQVSAKCITSDASGGVYIGGVFKCRMNEYSDQYGSSTFNSVGYWDIFTSKYNSSGVFQWARQIGSKQNETMGGIALTGPDVVLAGGFSQELFVPYAPGNFTLYDASVITSNIITPPFYCSDGNYDNYVELVTGGASDAFVGRAIDLSRQPYDFFWHSGSGCVLDTLPVCIITTTLDYGCFGDTVSVCQPPPSVALHGATQTSVYGANSTSIGPDYNYQWSTGSTQSTIFVSTPGQYSVTITSADGCFTSIDTVFLQFNPDPLTPTVTDDEGININDSTPLPVVVCGDSVLLTAGNLGNNNYSWTGPNGTTTSNPIIADTSGYYTITSVNQFGCTSLTTVLVTLDDPFVPIDPEMLLIEDTDLNDSISICDNEVFHVFIYDSITNPTPFTYLCIEDLYQVQWSVTPTGIGYASNTDCSQFTINTMNPSQTGWYLITATIIRRSACDTDTVVISHNYYIEVLPVPTAGQVTITINGSTQLCPGDTTALTASGAPGYLWSTGDTTATIYVSQPGPYTVSFSDTVFNQYGCWALQYGSASTFVTVKQPPTVTMNPGDGIICPGDSVQLVCSGTGTFLWQGPNGPVGGNSNTIYVSSPGAYSCVLTDNAGCQLVSNTVNVLQYNTPYLQAQPFPVLCGGDTVTISVVSNAGSLVSWQAPLSGNSLTQQVTQPGTYTCLITSCGITTPASVTVTGTQVSANAAIAGPYPICEGDSTMLIANAGMNSYNWQPGNFTGDSVWVNTAGTYTLVTTDPYNCSAQDTVSISVQPNNLVPPVVSDTTICRGQAIVLTAQGSPVIEWFTSPAGGTPFNTGETYTTGPITGDTLIYVLTHSGLCRSGMSAFQVNVDDCPPNVPNVFTPNGDGSNDIWTIYVPGAESVRVRIYNRWGQLIYEFTDVMTGWDGTVMQTGKPASDGVYYYIADVEVPSMGITNHTGFVHLIRQGGK